MRRPTFLLSLLCCACTERIPDFGIDLVHPIVLAIEPPIDSTDVDRDAPVRIVFSEPINQSTVTSETFQLLRDGIPVPGSVATTSTAATFTPALRLDDLSIYESLVSSAVRDRAGLELAAPFSAPFTTEDLQWEAPFAVSGTAGTFVGFGGVDEDGTVTLAWNDEVAVFSQRIVDGMPQSKHQIDVGANPLIGGLGVADDGTAFAIWTKQDSGHSDLYWSIRNSTSESWATPQLLETDDAGFVGNARLSVNASGLAVVAWNQTETQAPPFRANIYARQYAPGSGWGFLASLESSALTAEPPQVALGANGNAVANWAQSDGVGIRMWGSYYSPMDGWTSATVVDTNFGVTFARSHMDAQANGAVLWGGSNRAFNRYQPGVGWSGPQGFGGSSEMSSFVAGAMSEAGAGGMLTWNERHAEVDEIHVATLLQDGSVTPSVLVSSSQGSAATAQACGLDPAGRGFVLWFQDEEGRASLAGSRLNGGGWTAPGLLESDNIGEVTYIPAMDVGPNGEAVVLYFRYDGAGSQLWAVLLR